MLSDHLLACLLALSFVLLGFAAATAATAAVSDASLQQMYRKEMMRRK